MSLGRFEDAWVELMLDPDLRKRWRNDETDLDGLTPAESASLHAIADARMEATARAVNEGRISVFLAALPARVRELLPAARWRDLARDYAARHPLATLYPLHRTLPQWLNFLADTLRPENQPYLSDVLGYEALQNGLSFYRRPHPATKRGHSRLHTSSGLLVAGPYLSEVLFRLNRQQPIDDLPTTPRQGYLVRRQAEGIELNPVHWAVYELLQSATGQSSWKQRVADLCQEHPQLESQQEALLAWEAHYLAQGALTDDALA